MATRIGRDRVSIAGEVWPAEVLTMDEAAVDRLIVRRAAERSDERGSTGRRVLVWREAIFSARARERRGPPAVL